MKNIGLEILFLCKFLLKYLVWVVLYQCMMKLYFILWLCWIIFFLPEVANGQSAKSISGDLENVFKVLRPAERKELVEGYMDVMNGDFLTEKEKACIDTIFQELQGIPVSVTPELKDFVGCVIHFCRGRAKENLNVWLAGLERVLASTERKRTVIKNYLEETAGFACGQVLYRGSGHCWSVRGRTVWSGQQPIRVEFEEADLLCTTPKDSVVIYQTRGYAYLGKSEVYGNGGDVEWRAMKDSIRVELSAYRIDLKSSGYSADSVRFHYDTRYARPLLGQLKDNALKYTRKKDTPYPEFSSYAKDIVIPNMYKHITYRGGVNYAGLKFTGEGTAEQPALLEIIPNDTIAMRLYTQQFLFDSLRIFAGKAAMSIAMDSGEITHPDINFLYAVPRHTVTVKRITEQSMQVPFKDSYHRILFDMEEIVWPLDSPVIEMKMSNRSGLFKATIESLNFFSDDVYDQIQGLDEINPLNGLLKCSQMLDSEVFTLGEYADFLKKPIDQLRKQVILLSYKDFVDYNENSDEVTLKQRLYDYTLARVGKQDYDNIRFSSHPSDSRVNALLDVRNFRLKIMGVEKFLISENRNIYVEPSDRQVVMMKNRDMEFNGRLNAGMFDMFGHNLFFSYDQYKISLPKVDSTRIYAGGPNKKDRGEKIRSLIRDIAGEIIIDTPGNKSGKQKDPGFPVLNSKQESFVYFDDPDIQHGQYDREQFYFVIKPYKIEGMNDATKLKYTFDGTLVSGIVSPIEDTLRLMDDNALGLVYQTPDTGLELYGKGRLRSRIVLNRQGFQADGKVDMNHSRFCSDSILMLPLKMTAITPEMHIDSITGQRPEASGKQLKVNYLPETGNLHVTSTTEPFEIYHGRIKHEGSLLVYGQKLDASGRLQLEDAQLQSKLLHLQADRILAQSTELSLSSIQNHDIHLNTKDVKAEINLTANTGKFVNNTETNRAVFTSGYVCSFESFTWYMKDAYLNIGIEDEQQLMKLWKTEDPDLLPLQGKNVFVATKKMADSLTFIAPLAHYDLNSGDIDCRWVNHIDIANGRFYPGDGNVFIGSEGKIREFTGGKLLCERKDTTRILTEVDLGLEGRLRFRGAANYTYITEEKRHQPIRFTEIGVDSSKLILVKASITEEQPLMLNDGFRFKGKVTLHSRQPHLFFSGYAGLTTSTDFLKHQWFYVNHYLDATHIRIPVGVENKNDKQLRIYNGIFLNADKTFRPYAAFMSNRIFYKDDLLAGGKGELEWAAPIKQYVISDTLHDRYNRFRYDTETATVSAYGRLNLDPGISGVYQRTAGNIAYSLKEEKLEMARLLYLIDFSLLNKMEVVLQKDLGQQKTMRVSSGLKEKIYELYGKNVMPVVEKKLNQPLANVPDSLARLFVLDSLNIGWNEKTRSYMSDGRVVVKAVRGKPVERVMNIKLELLRRHSGNQLFMYIYDDQMWYYFEFADNTLYTLSSNPEYNEVLKTEKADRKVIQNKAKETLYTLTLCPDSKKERFLGRVKK